MPVGYACSVALMGLCTWLAVAPPHPRSSRPGRPSFWLGYLLEQLPFVGLAWLAASTALAAVEGDLASPWAWPVVVAAAVTAAALGLIIARQLRASKTVGDALHDTLGAAHDQKPYRAPWVRIIVLPFWFRRRDVERLRDLRYGDAGDANLLDVFRHRSAPRGAPVLVHFHGGTFRSGRKSKEAQPVLQRLASRGWVCVSANYRLTPQAIFPDQLIDAKQVIGWVRTHAGELGIDPARLFVAGCSAGAHLAATSALTPNRRDLQPGFEHTDTSVAGAICLYGYYGPVDDSQRPSSPHDYVNDAAPPFLVAHGDNDTIVIVEDAQRLVTELRRVSTCPVTYVELRGAQHVFDLFHSIRIHRLIDGIERFAAHVEAQSGGASTS
jgi:acetyl esterase/lipase